MRVKATDMSMRLRVGIKELHRIASPGEEFNVTNVRYNILSGDNKYKAVFVTKIAADDNDSSPKKRARKTKDNQVETNGNNETNPE